MNEWEWNLLENKAPLASLERDGVAIAVGDQVRLHPRRCGDAMDLFLTGKIATVEAIEQDYENQVHVAVVVDEDPGRDLGLARQPGHRFFFVPDEIELVEKGRATASTDSALPSILVAGIGNIFFGDDAFGVEVVRRLDASRFPPKVKIVDFGIRGFDLANALCDPYDVAIFVDACPRGAAPGTLHLIEPNLTSPDGDVDGAPDSGPHGLDPLNVIRLARVMGSTPGRILIVGCEPETLGGDEGAMGLSDAVSAAAAAAVPFLESLATRLSRREPIEDEIADNAAVKER
jgi:hydrogenase maturation protease